MAEEFTLRAKLDTSDFDKKIAGVIKDLQGVQGKIKTGASGKSSPLSGLVESVEKDAERVINRVKDVEKALGRPIKAKGGASAALSAEADKIEKKAASSAASIERVVQRAYTGLHRIGIQASNSLGNVTPHVDAAANATRGYIDQIKNLGVSSQQSIRLQGEYSRSLLTQSDSIRKANAAERERVSTLEKVSGTLAKATNTAQTLEQQLLSAKGPRESKRDIDALVNALTTLEADLVKSGAKGADFENAMNAFRGSVNEAKGSLKSFAAEQKQQSAISDQAAKALERQRTKYEQFVASTRKKLGSNADDFIQKYERDINELNTELRKHGTSSQAAVRAQEEFRRKVISTNSAVAVAVTRQKEYARSNNRVLAGITGLNRQMGSMQRVIFNTSVAIQGMMAAFGLREIIRANTTLERFRATLRASTDDMSEYHKSLDFVENTARTFGLSIGELGVPFSRFSVAANAAGMEQEAIRDNFEKLAGASRNFGLSTADTAGVIKAFEQSLAKGKFMAEEVRLQMGDRMPIAMQALAKAVGVTNEELSKMMENGELFTDRYAEDFIQAIFDMSGGAEQLARMNQTLTAELGKLGTSLTLAAGAVGEGGFNDAVKEASRTLRTFLDSAEGQDALRSIGVGFTVLADVVKILASNLNLVLAGFGLLVAFKMTAWLTAATAGFASLRAVIAGTAGATKTLKAALLSTGIGAVAVGLGYLVSRFMETSDELDRNREISDNLRKANEALSESHVHNAEKVEDITRAYKNLSEEMRKVETWKITNLIDAQADEINSIVDRIAGDMQEALQSPRLEVSVRGDLAGSFPDISVFARQSAITDAVRGRMEAFKGTFEGVIESVIDGSLAVDESQVAVLSLADTIGGPLDEALRSWLITNDDQLDLLAALGQKYVENSDRLALYNGDMTAAEYATRNATDAAEGHVVAIDEVARSLRDLHTSDDFADLTSGFERVSDAISMLGANVPADEIINFVEFRERFEEVRKVIEDVGGVADESGEQFRAMAKSLWDAMQTSQDNATIHSLIMSEAKQDIGENADAWIQYRKELNAINRIALTIDDDIASVEFVTRMAEAAQNNLNESLGNMDSSGFSDAEMAAYALENQLWDVKAAQDAINNKDVGALMGLSLDQEAARLEKLIALYRKGDTAGIAQAERAKRIREETAAAIQEAQNIENVTSLEQARIYVQNNLADQIERNVDLSIAAENAQEGYNKSIRGGTKPVDEYAKALENAIQALRGFADIEKWGLDGAPEAVRVAEEYNEVLEELTKTGKAEEAVIRDIVEARDKHVEMILDEVSARADIHYQEHIADIQAETAALLAGTDAYAAYTKQAEMAGKVKSFREAREDFYRENPNLNRDDVERLAKSDAEQYRSALRSNLTAKEWHDYYKEVESLSQRYAGDIADALITGINDGWEDGLDSMLDIFDNWYRDLQRQLLMQPLRIVTDMIVGSAPQMFGINQPAGMSGSNAQVQSGGGGFGLGDLPSMPGGGNGLFEQFAFSDFGQGLGLSETANVINWADGTTTALSNGPTSLTSAGSFASKAMGGIGYGIGSVMGFAEGDLVSGISNAVALGVSMIPGGQFVAPFIPMLGSMLGGLFGGEAIPNASQSFHTENGRIVAQAPQGRLLSDEEIQRWGEASRQAVVEPMQRFIDVITAQGRDFGYMFATSNKDGMSVGAFGGGLDQSGSGTWTDIDALPEAPLVLIRQIVEDMAIVDETLADALLVVQQSSADTADALTAQIAVASDWTTAIKDATDAIGPMGQQLAQIDATTEQFGTQAEAVLTPFVEVRNILGEAGRAAETADQDIESLVRALVGLESEALQPVEVQTRIIDGRFSALADVLTGLGWSADETSAYLAGLRDEVDSQRIAQFDDANLRAIEDLSGRGHVNQLRDMGVAMADVVTQAREIGADVPAVWRRIRLEVGAVTDGMPVGQLQSLVREFEAASDGSLAMETTLYGLRSALIDTRRAAEDAARAQEAAARAAQRQAADEEILSRYDGIQQQVRSAETLGETWTRVMAAQRQEMAQWQALGADTSKGSDVHRQEAIADLAQTISRHLSNSQEIAESLIKLDERRSFTSQQANQGIDESGYYEGVWDDVMRGANDAGASLVDMVNSFSDTIYSVGVSTAKTSEEIKEALGLAFAAPNEASSWEEFAAQVNASMDVARQALRDSSSGVITILSALSEGISTIQASVAGGSYNGAAFGGVGSDSAIRGLQGLYDAASGGAWTIEERWATRGMEGIENVMGGLEGSFRSLGERIEQVNTDIALEAIDFAKVVELLPETLRTPDEGEYTYHDMLNRDYRDQDALNEITRGIGAALADVQRGNESSLYGALNQFFDMALQGLITTGTMSGGRDPVYVKGELDYLVDMAMEAFSKTPPWVKDLQDAMDTASQAAQRAEAERAAADAEREAERAEQLRRSNEQLIAAENMRLNDTLGSETAFRVRGIAAGLQGAGFGVLSGYEDALQNMTLTAEEGRDIFTSAAAALRSGSIEADEFKGIMGLVNDALAETGGGSESLIAQQRLTLDSALDLTSAFGTMTAAADLGDISTAILEQYSEGIENNALTAEQAESIYTQSTQALRDGAIAADEYSAVINIVTQSLRDGSERLSLELEYLNLIGRTDLVRAHQLTQMAQENWDIQAEIWRLGDLQGTIQGTVSTFEAAASAWESIADQVADTLRNIRIGADTLLSPGERFDEAIGNAQTAYADFVQAQADYASAATDDAREAAMERAQDAAGALTSLAPQVLALARENWGIGGETGEVWDWINTNLADVEGFSRQQVSIDEQALRTAQSQLDALHDISGAMADGFGGLITGIDLLGDDIATAMAALAAAGATGMTDSGSGGSAVARARHDTIAEIVGRNAGLVAMYGSASAASAALATASDNTIRGLAGGSNVRGFAAGGFVPDVPGMTTRGRDSFPAMLMPGELVIPTVHVPDFQAMARGGAANDDMVAEIRALRAEVTELRREAARGNAVNYEGHKMVASTVERTGKRRPAEVRHAS